MIKEISVLDIKRGDTVVVQPGAGRHRGKSADSGCYEVSGFATKSLSAFNLLTPGAHSKPRPKELYAVFVGYEGCSWDEERVAVPATETVTVMR